MAQDGQLTLSTLQGHSCGSEGGQSQEQDGRQQERQFARVSQMRRVAVDTATQDLLARLLTDTRAAGSVDDLARALRPAVAKPSPGLAQALVGVARLWQTVRAEQPPAQPTSLAQVRRALVQAAQGPADPAASVRDERREIMHLWLPVYLLNLGRPRLPAQGEQAAQRMALIERALGRRAGTAD